MNTEMLDQINKKIEEIKTNKDQINQLTIYKTRAKELQELIEKLKKAFAPLRALKETEIPLGDLATVKERSQKVLKLVENLKSQILEDATSLSASGFLDPLKSVVDTLEDQASQIAGKAWAQEVDRHLCVINGQFLEMMGKMSLFAVEAERLSLERKSLSEEKNRIPASPQKISTFLGRAKELKERYRELVGRIGNDPEVRTFLVESSSEKGASLSLLTQPVMEWIKGNALEDHFRIFGGNR